MQETTDEQTRLLVHVKYAAAAVDECVHQLHEAVRGALTAEATWSQIGEALGTSAQEAADEFGPAADGADDPRPEARHAAGDRSSTSRA